MSGIEAPPAFLKFAKNFRNFDGHGPLPINPLAHFEKQHLFAMKWLDDSEKRALADFLDECLDGTHSENELLRLWQSGRPQAVIKPAARFFGDIRSRLRAQGY